MDDLHFEIDDLRELVEKLIEKLNERESQDTTQLLVDDI